VAPLADIDALVAADCHLQESKPITLQEWAAKWRTIVEYYEWLADGSFELENCYQMIDELEAIIEAPRY